MKRQFISLGANNPFITEMQIEELFGLYTYRLAVLRDTNVDLSRLLILYGDNGSGKTTILKLVFNLLSNAPSRGHRGFVASVPFRRFEIRLGEVRIMAYRPNGNLTGSFQITVSKENTKVWDGLIEADAENKVEESASVNAYLAILNELNLDLFYLSDDRNAQSSVYRTSEETSEGTWMIIETEEGEFRQIKSGSRARQPLRREQILEVAIRGLESWIRHQALKGSNEGEANTNTIYSDIAKRIAKARGSRRKDTNKEISGLPVALRELEQRSKSFFQLGLISRLQLTGMISTLESASSGKKPILANVLIPYVDGLSARLDALQDLKDLIELFIKSVNSFFHNKTVSFDIGEGIKIFSSNGETLAPKLLSSGERQLLLLFCNTITARDQASIFIIDEPEISLNVKWQRRLLDTLLRFTKRSDVQFVVATHSVELLARHKANVLRLASAPGEVYAQLG